MNDRSDSPKRRSVLAPWTWHRSAKVFAAFCALVLVFVNLPGQVVNYPRIELSDKRHSPFPMDWRYEHGWPWTYLVRADVNHTWNFNRLSFGPDPSAIDCWLLWSDSPRRNLVALVGDSVVGVSLAYGMGVLFELWRRRRAKSWSFHVIDLFAGVSLFAVLLGAWISCRDRFALEKRVMGLDTDSEFAYFSYPSIEHGNEQLGGPSWLRLLGDDSPLRSLDRVVAITLSAELLPEALPLCELRSVSIDGGMSADGLNALADFPRLEALSLVNVKPVDGVGGWPAPDTTSIELPDLPRLRGLSFSSIDHPIAGLTRLSSLEVLFMTNFEPKEETFRDLYSLANLRKLSLTNAFLKGPTVKHLAGLTRLEALALDNTAIEDESLKHIATLGELRDLSLHATNITRDGLRHLVALPKLERLDLRETRICADDADVLTQFRSLRTLRVDFTEPEVQELRTRIPHCEID